MGMPIGKKRFYITLNEERMNWFYNWFQEKGFPKTAMSLLFDEMLRSTQKTIQELERREEAGEEISMTELFSFCTKVTESDKK